MTERREDTADLVAGLTARLEGVLDALAPAWVARGRRAYLAPKANGDLGSWQVELAGPDRGLWVRYSQPSDRGGRFMGGGPLGLVAYCLSGETSSRVDRRACDWARAFLGMRDERADARAAREARIAAAKDRERARLARLEADRAGGRLKARDLWRAARPADGTFVETYLAHRAIALDRLGGVPRSIRFAPALPYWFAPATTKGAAKARPVVVHEGPAMVAAVQPADGGPPAAVHLTWLAPDGRGKAAIVAPDGAPLPARKIRGEAAGGFVRFAPAGPDMVVAEGIETTLTVAAALGRAAWAALSLGNLAAPVPSIVERVTLALDNDERDPRLARKAKNRAIAAHATRGVVVRPIEPPVGHDWNSLAAGMRRRHHEEVPHETTA